MGSPLGPVLADIFMIELEKAILQELPECIKYCKRYADDTISFFKLGTINYIITKLNSFDNSIQFTFEEEDEGTLPFLDALIHSKGNSIIIQKPTNNDIYLNWNTFAPDTWKRETLKTLVERAYIAYSTNELLQKELKYLAKVFYETNNYPHYVIKQILKQVQDEQNQQNVNVPTAAIADEINTNEKKEHVLLVPYQGNKRDYVDYVIKSMKKRMKCFLPTGIVTKIAYVGNELRTCFCVNDVTEVKHNHDIIYQGRCLEIGCNDQYLGETGCRISGRVIDHAGRDQNPHLFKHFIEIWH